MQERRETDAAADHDDARVRVFRQLERVPERAVQVDAVALVHASEHARPLPHHVAEDADAGGTPAHVFQQVEAGKRAAQQRVKLIADADVEELPGLHVLGELRRIEVEFEIAVAVVNPAGDGDVMQQGDAFRGSVHARTMLAARILRNVWRVRARASYLILDWWHGRPRPCLPGFARP